MSVIIVLIGFSITVALGFLLAFIWASGSGQYDDDYTPSIRILFDDEPNQTFYVNNDSHQPARRKGDGK
ncbi:cbb3-type cytochrome oxidase assembly protein CcoS [Marinoscillum luteum]|uniref:Cbb3-type cytochrome oxidase assembly protein CcoS n=1 Tax=Marinoscillum luteum TaxID=861051 RepID=A0ABW7NFH3_9BACT